MSVFGPAQFSAGDQGPKKWIFAASNMKCCPECNGQQITSEKIPEGCRMNGDAYGTTVFICDSCKWKTSFLWDESSSDYYYEKPLVMGFAHHLAVG
jgi:hypothetical protein